MNYYEHHLGDYLRDTAHLSMVEDGAYRRLLDVYYVKEQPLPLEPRDVFRLVRASTKNDRDAVLVVLREFFTEAADGWRHKRCDAEIERFKDKQAKAKRSAEARWGTPRAASDGNANASPDAHADDMRTHSEGNAPRARPQAPSPQSPITSDKETVGRTSTRGTRLAPEWALPDEWREWARAERPDLDLDRTADRFRDYWTAVPGAKATRASWVATWRNWVRNERAENRPHPQGQYARSPAAEPDWRREQRERTQQAAPYAASQPRTARVINPDPQETFDAIPLDKTAR